MNERVQSIQLNVRLWPDELEALRQIAAREQRTMSGQVRRWIEEAEPQREAA